MASKHFIDCSHDTLREARWREDGGEGRRRRRRRRRRRWRGRKVKGKGGRTGRREG